ncbi:MAG: IclR family transcriptional regulator [Burkholderiaceae bacterium]
MTRRISRTAAKVSEHAYDVVRLDFVSSLAKGLAVLEAFDQGELLGNQELMQRTGLPKATVSRLTGTLAALGYLRMDERSRKFVIGARVLGIGARVQRHIGLQRVARPFMEKLAHELDVSVILGVGDGPSLIFLDVVRPIRPRLVVNTGNGSVMPVESTAVGMAYLLGTVVSERARLIESLRRRYPAGEWDAIRRKIERAHRDYAAHGFVVSRHDRQGSVSGVGVPMPLDAKGVFAFSCVGPSFEMSMTRLMRVMGPRLVETVDLIRDAMQGAPNASPAPRRATGQAAARRRS